MSGRAKFTNLLFWSVKNGNSFLRPNDQLDLSRDGPICLDEGYVYLKCTWLNNQSTQVKKKKKKKCLNGIIIGKIMSIEKKNIAYAIRQIKEKCVLLLNKSMP